MDIRRLNKEERAIYDEAVAMLEGGTSAVPFAQYFFSQGGRLAALASDEAHRRGLIESELFTWLYEQLEMLRRPEAEAFMRDAQALSGRLTIMVPKSLHAALKAEATQEGVSLSELMRLKLGVPYQAMTRWLAGEPSAGSGAKAARRASRTGQSKPLATGGRVRVDKGQGQAKRPVR